MSDNVEASGPLRAEQAPLPLRTRRGPWRTVVFPVLVIAAIAAAIWWLEYRPQGDVSPLTGENYGLTALPSALVPTGMDVGAEAGALAPDFLLETLDGGELRLSDLRGKAVVLNFWATWCRPCRREIPQLVAVHDEFRDGGLVVVAVNVQEAKGTIRRYADDFGMEFPIPIDRRGDVAQEYRAAPPLPKTYFIDRDGVVRSVYVGPLLEKVRDIDVAAPIEENELLKRIAEIME